MATQRTCERKGCSNVADMQCPKCLSLNLEPSYFCSQACFKTSWNEHKEKHVVVSTNQMQQILEQKANSQLPSTFEGFAFTGPLRPGIVSPKRQVPSHIPRPDYAETGDPISETASKSAGGTIEVKTPTQIKALRECCRLAREVLDIGGKAAKVGVTTDEIDRVVHEAIIERNAYPSPLNYRGFPKSCCTSVNEVICHGIPDSRELCDGDILNIDVSLFYEGVHSDLNETYLIGNVEPKYVKLVEVTRQALDLAIQIVKPGTLYRDIGNVISRHVHQHGFSVARSYCGHGIGALFHDTPSIPHYAKNKAVGVMKPGHVFTIEPMINEGSWQDVLWPDDWTDVTKDGKRSAQFEHTLLVTETGCEVLTAAKK